LQQMTQEKFPQWLQVKNELLLPEYKRTWLSNDYLEKMLNKINNALATDSDSFNTVCNRAILQQVEPHTKFIGLLVLILSAALTKNMLYLVGLNLVTFGFALQSGIRCSIFFLRVWLPTIMFVGITVLPGIINWVTPGEAMCIVYSGINCNIGSTISLPTDLTITRQGVQAAFFVIFRSAASLGLVTLLIKTTRWSILTKILVKFGLPATIVAVLDLTYRYIFLFMILLLEYLMGRKSRLVGAESQSAKIAWIGETIASFFRLAREYSQEIDQAMQSRGYNGEYYPVSNIKLRLIDTCFGLVVILLCYYAAGGNNGWIFSI